MFCKQKFGKNFNQFVFYFFKLTFCPFFIKVSKIGLVCLLFQKIHNHLLEQFCLNIFKTLLEPYTAWPIQQNKYLIQIINVERIQQHFSTLKNNQNSKYCRVLFFTFEVIKKFFINFSLQINLFNKNRVRFQQIPYSHYKNLDFAFGQIIKKQSFFLYQFSNRYYLKKAHQTFFRQLNHFIFDEIIDFIKNEINHLFFLNILNFINRSKRGPFSCVISISILGIYFMSMLQFVIIIPILKIK
eukprot:TRINITY_DN95_c3_g2_i5.p1 TRINITY_DN95_c3_g2~~TRINITY_DN95_c3_g2_i5.p1  ORF type:complete len:242 (-),score=-18.87 TRINITY_DN95_c3_g2_i5:808-1533(-)